MTSLITYDISTQTITLIDKTFRGDIEIKKSYENVEVKKIGTAACKYGLIKSLDLSQTVIESIEEGSFLGCTELKSIKLPETIL